MTKADPGCSPYVVSQDYSTEIRFVSTAAQSPGKNFCHVSFAEFKPHCFLGRHFGRLTKFPDDPRRLYMKNFFVSLVVALFLFASHGTAAAQDGTVLSEELRPFDFSDKYYQVNGIHASTLIGRKNGADKASVFDFSTDPKFTNVRIIETRPAYSADGTTIFWNLYGGATKASLTDENGGDAYNLAEAYPVYVFPSTTVKGSDRQAAMIHPDEAYYAKNPLGIGSIVIIEYTAKFFTKQAWKVRQAFEEKNGISLDGTPIIKTAGDLADLASEGYVTLRRPQSPIDSYFLIAKVIQHPDRGGITPDAFLEFVKQPNGEPLPAETHFLKHFECMQAGGSPCF